MFVVRKNLKLWIGSWLLIATTSATPLLAQDATQLEGQLKSIMKVTEFDSVKTQILHPGMVVKLSKDSLFYRTPMSQPVVCSATVRESKNEIPSTLCRATMKAYGDYLPAGQTLYVTKIQVNPSKDTVSIGLIEALMDPATGGPDKPRFKTGVNFVFSHGYLAKADAGQIADVIGGVLPQGALEAPPQQPLQQAAAAPAPVGPPPPMAVPVAMVAGGGPELGMTEEQIRALLGPPSKATAPSGTTKVYVYHKQIVFQNGRVTSIE